MNQLCGLSVTLFALVLAPALLAQSGSDQWLREDYTAPGAKPPVQVPDGNPRLTAEVTGGVFRLVDGGAEQGDLLTCDKAWCADPVLGASCRASVKVVRGDGLAGVMIGFSDGVHEDLLTLYHDRIELYRAQRAFVMDTTDGFHAYQVDICGSDVTVRVDARAVIQAAGAFTFPAHQGRNRFSFGSGASASQGEALWQGVAWTDGAAALRKRWPVMATAEQVTVFKQDGVYACFPSLRLDPATGCLVTTFSKKTVRTHYETLDATRGVMASGDGGRTWRDVERVPVQAAGPRPEEVFTAADGALVRIGQNWRRWFPPEQRPADELAHETSDGVLWLLTRVEGGDDHLWQAVSRDGGRTWLAAKSPIRGHPPSGLVRLADGCLVLTYGYRHPPYGIRAVVSRDEGLTWDTDPPPVLRNDGGGYDLGYPVSMVLADQTIVTMYYFVLPDDGISHIACTRWRVVP